MNRGNKLWEGSRMILPEHRAAMLEKEWHDDHLVERPVLDEEKLAEMSRVIGAAMKKKRLVTLTIYEQYINREVTMLPKRFDAMTRTLHGLSQLGEQQLRVSLEDIIDVNAE